MKTPARSTPFRRLVPRGLHGIGRRILAARWLQVLATEYGFRFRRGAVDRLLEETGTRPRALHLETTNVCNARCVFCAYPQMERPKTTMSMQRFVDVIDQYVEGGGSHVSLTPIVGDPFADPLLFERLDHLARRQEIRGFYFFTNAILMTPEVSRRLQSYAERLRLCVSMGGFDRRTYARLMGVDQFDKVWDNIRHFVENSTATPPFGARLEIHTRCAPRDRTGPVWDRVLAWEDEGRLEVVILDEYDSWAGKIAVEDLSANGLRPSAMPHKKGACELLYMKPVVLADGRVNACACRDVEADLVVGDLEHQTLEEIIGGPALAALRERHRNGDYPEVCQRCTYYVSVYDPLKSRIGSNDLNWGRSPEG